MSSALLDANQIPYPDELIAACDARAYRMFTHRGAGGLLVGSGVTALQRDELPALESEWIDGLSVSQAQDGCQIWSFSYDNKTGAGSVDAVVSLREKADRIAMQGLLVDTLGKRVIGRLPPPPEVRDKAFCEMKTDFRVDGPAQVGALAVIVQGEWYRGNEHCASVTKHDSTIGGFDISYEHDRPQKEKVTVTIQIQDAASDRAGVVLADPNGSANDRGSSEKIVIAFNSTIHKTYDIDYLCNVKYSPSGKPYFTVPGMGSIGVAGASPVITEQDYPSAVCRVTQESGGGMVLHEYDYNYTPGVFHIVGDELRYDMHMSWKQNYIGPTYPTHPDATHQYSLTITAPFKTPTGRTYIASVTVSSRETPPSQGALVHKIPALLFTWDCVAQDTPISMADGSVRAARDIGPGDELLGADGRPVRVTAVDAGFQEMGMIELTHGDGRLLITGDHPVLTRCGWRAASALSPGDEVSAGGGEWRRLTATGLGAYSGKVITLTLDGKAGYVAAGIAVGDSRTADGQTEG